MQRRFCLILIFGLLLTTLPAISVSAQGSCSGTWYEVQEGDTLFGISLMYGSDVVYILQANELDEDDFIYMGQELCVPDSLLIYEDAHLNGSQVGSIDEELDMAASAEVIYEMPMITVKTRAIPDSQVRIFVSSVQGDTEGGVVAIGDVDEDGYVDFTFEEPLMNWRERQYVMIRSYDGTMTWGFFDKPKNYTGGINPYGDY